ncbi:hypothetical protein BASA81_003074 [Batrachochytrium salamandrivorans]|nr:hypothetical protein BASA81_003074 [Batrachochytrium salamandrivorans]
MKQYLALGLGLAWGCEFRLELEGISGVVECTVPETIQLSNHRPIYACNENRHLLHDEEGSWKLMGRENEVLFDIPSWAVSPANFATSSPKLAGVVMKRCNSSPLPNTFHILSDQFPASFYTKAAPDLYYGTTSELYAWFDETGSVAVSQLPINNSKPEFICERPKCVLMMEDDKYDAHQNLIWSRNKVRSTHEFQLVNGLILPLFGLGTGGMSPMDTATIVQTAYEQANYNLIDTASAYGNEREIGEYVTHLLSKPFVVTKVWPTELGFHRTIQSMLESRQKLQTNVLDVVLLHWPKCYAEWQVDWMDCSQAEIDLEGDLWLESWRAMEKLYAEGLVYAIGVSNFDLHLLNIAASHKTQVTPHFVQNHFAIGNLDLAVVNWCKELGVYYQAYGLIRNGIPKLKEKPTHMTDLEFLVQITVKAKIGVLLRSTTPEHVISNAQIADAPIQVQADILTLFAEPESCTN